MKFSGKSQESLSSPISFIRTHSFLILFSLALIKDSNLSFSVDEDEKIENMVGADVDEPMCFEGSKLGRFTSVGSDK